MNLNNNRYSDIFVAMTHKQIDVVIPKSMFNAWFTCSKSSITRSLALASLLMNLNL